MFMYSKDSLADIYREINGYIKSNNRKTPSSIIINEKDTVRLLEAMFKAKLIPDTTPPKKFVLFSQRFIRSMDMAEGNFDVVLGGNIRAENIHQRS